MEKLLSLPPRKDTSAPQSPGQQLVTQIKPTRELHRAPAPAANPSTPAPSTSENPFRSFRITMDNGRQKVEVSTLIEATKRDPELMPGLKNAYENGRPLPVVVTLTADAELRPGVDLSQLRWQVAESITWPDGIGEIMGKGDFPSGLVQTCTLPGEWAERHALYIKVWVAGLRAETAK